MLRRDYRTAALLIKRGRDVADSSGDIRCITALEANAAYIQIAIGRFSAARVACQRFGTASPFVLEKLGGLDAAARLELATENLDACESALDEIGKLTTLNPALAANYNARWAGLTRARLLVQRQAFEQAILCAQGTRGTARSTGDGFLAAACDALIAQVYGSVGSQSAAARRLVAAELGRITTFRELQAEYYLAVAGIMNAEGHSDLKELNERRSLRISRHDGVVLPKFSLGGRGLGHRRPEAVIDQALGVANCLASMFDTAFSPRLVGAEILETLSLLHCTRDARLMERSTHVDVPGSSEQTVVLPLGDDRDKRLSIECPTPDEPHNALVLSNVFTVARAALALETYKQEERNRAAIWPADPAETEAGALFLSEDMRALLETVRRVAPAPIPILLTGETGTGKEVLARLVHAYSNRAKGHFVPFNCSAVPKDMLDAQLFGHRRGAFTGAVDTFAGVIRGASGGTLFLDEMGETTLDVQPKLLRFLESSEVHPIGELQPVRVDVRVIAATNADLEALVTQGRFREDLFYRLNIVRLHVPPLRDRRVEIPALANHYLQKFAHEFAKGELRLAEETMEYLVLYRWPGNVRQLANEMRRLAALAETGAVLMPEHLSPDIAASRRTVPPSERVLDSTEVVVRLDQPLPAAVQHVERAVIQYAMKKSGGGLEETAALLGISRKGLYLKRSRYGIDPPAGIAAVDVA
jgi:DNA-binding NtrC family response regulator